MARVKAQFIKGPNGLVNLSSLVGIIKAENQLYGFNARGYMAMYFNSDTPERDIDEAHKTVSDNIGFNGVLNTPCGGGLSIDIIGEIFVNPKSDNLVISSIATDKALLILKADDYSDMDALYDEVQNTVIELSNGKNTKVDWKSHTA